MPIQQLANYVQTTLASGCTSGALTISVVSAAGLPTSGNFMLRIDDASPATTFEYVECTGVSGTTLTVTRGQEGTTGIAHSAGAFVGNDLTAGMLARGFVDKGIKARAFVTTPQSALASGTFTKINLDTVTYDPSSGLDVVTNHRYVAPVAGYYLVIAAVGFAGTVSGVEAAIYKNGVAWAKGGIGAGVSASNSAGSVSDIVQLTATDYVELWALQSSGGALANLGGTTVTFLSVHFLSVA